MDDGLQSVLSFGIKINLMQTKMKGIEIEMLTANRNIGNLENSKIDRQSSINQFKEL